MNKRPIETSETARDRDLRLSGQALRRAALGAREVAARTGTEIVIILLDQRPHAQGERMLHRKAMPLPLRLLAQIARLGAPGSSAQQPAAIVSRKYAEALTLSPGALGPRVPAR